MFGPIGIFSIARMSGKCSPFSHLTPIYQCVKRAFLPGTYHCNQLWASRLRHEAFARASPRDLGLVLLRDIDANKIVSTLDYDIFINKLHELEVTALDFAENVIRKYARTQSAVRINDATVHALVRGLIGFDHADKLLSLLSQRSETAVFLDYVSANLLMDHFIDKQEWESALEVAWELYLQDDTHTFLSAPISLALTLFAAQKQIQCLWPNENGSNEAIMDSDDVEYKYVTYVRNANYDGRFDVQRFRLKLGFLLLQLAKAVVAFVPPPSKRTPSLHEAVERAKSVLPRGLQMFGLACSDQLGTLHANLQKITAPDQLQRCGLSSAVFDSLARIISSAKSRRDDSSPEYREPVLPTCTEVDTAMGEVERILEIAEPLDDCFFSACSEFVNRVVNNEELVENETEVVKQMYVRFAKDRDRIWETYLDTFKKRSTITESKKCLRGLLDEEERLTYFKHSEEILQNAWLAPRTLKERRWSRMKQWRQDVIKVQEEKQVVR